MLNNEESFKKSLLKDFAKLAEKLKQESDRIKINNIINSMLYIDEILNDNFSIDNSMYNYYDVYMDNYKLFKNLLKNEDLTIKSKISTLKTNIEIYKNIYNSNKKNLSDFKIFNEFNDIKPSNLTKKEFYDVICNIPLGDLGNHIFNIINSNKLHIVVDKSFDDMFLNAYEYSLFPINKYYHVIESNVEYSYLNIIAAAHEMSHSYVEKKYHVNTVLNLFREVFPYFIEFIISDYLLYSKGINDGIINYYGIMMNLKKCYKKSFKIKNYKTYKLQQYSLGELVAFSFYEMLKIDKEALKYYLIYFLKNIDIIEPIELLRKSHIDTEKLVSGEVCKQMIKKYNNDCKKIKS